jgi:16S rRNA (uracil1498-N3)-methyltransferase
VGVGSEIIVLDDTGREYKARLDRVESQQCTAEILKIGICANEPAVKVEMQLCLSQREKFEGMLQKCTEVGVSGFVPILSNRTLVQNPGDVSDKYPRWKKIIREAAEQSARGRLPELEPPMRLMELVVNASTGNSLKLIPYEGERTCNLKQTLKDYKGNKISILVGPEGGFSPEEVKLARENGYQPVTLGKRILRMETAAIVAAAMVLYQLDE